MTRGPRAPGAPGLLLAAVALALALAGCGGSSGSDDSGADTAGLPTAEDPATGDATAKPSEDRDEPATAGMCAPEEPDCQDTIAPGDGDVDGGTDSGGPASGSCLAGDEDCTDESYGGQDMARPIPLSGSPSDAERIERGATSGATGREVTTAYLSGDAVLELTFGGGACDLLEDVVVEESPGEVRVLVLSGMDASVDMCTQQIVQWSTEIELDAPLGDRQLLDLAG